MAKSMSPRESFAWGIVLLQLVYIALFTISPDIDATVKKSPSPDTSAVIAAKQQDESPHKFQPHNGQIPTRLKDDETGEEFLKIFHTASSFDHPLHGGTCWCTNPVHDDFCTCTPSLAIDVILASGPDHVWLVKRADAGQYATMGGFIEVGETSAQAVVRELAEETSFTISSPPRLFGIYDDPARDVKRHRHSVSVVYVVNIPLDALPPTAGDDVKEVVRVSLEELDSMDFFIDHKTVLLDYRRSLGGGESSVGSATNVDWNSPFQRVVCDL